MPQKKAIKIHLLIFWNKREKNVAETRGLVVRKFCKKIVERKVTAVAL